MLWRALSSEAALKASTHSGFTMDMDVNDEHGIISGRAVSQYPPHCGSGAVGAAVRRD
jgi:hypothetical protein